LLEEVLKRYSSNNNDRSVYVCVVKKLLYICSRKVLGL
jgi:hypothetical protein